MFLLPVIDLRGGVVVRGVGGHRSEYRPLVSRLTRSTHPFEVASAFRDQLGLTELYLADLDAIGGGEPARATFAGLRERGFRCWVDAGVRDADDAGRVQTAGVAVVVVGLETVRGPQALQEIVAAVGSEETVFSLDLRDGEPLGDRVAWGNASALAIAEQVVAVGVRRMIVLDLARVGVGGGTGTEPLCMALKERHPSCRIVAGGGIRGVDDLHRLSECGIDGVLLASALHDGAVSRRFAEALRNYSRRHS